ncbi:hypothetical protein ZHAS_00007528 [Anopheles sinensis]|uniref:Uncharacterized protein n=1 Tax=Anopheles sinensis TaxID=74873 RepID=A0A084VQ23_ANOSI|nr:hypothetical protein ZHAS_00007528 [Anopheles sinensis]
MHGITTVSHVEASNGLIQCVREFILQTSDGGWELGDNESCSTQDFDYRFEIEFKSTQHTCGQKLNDRALYQ